MQILYGHKQKVILKEVGQEQQEDATSKALLHERQDIMQKGDDI